MKFKGQIMLPVVCLILISVTAGASDYKTWIPVLPDAISGMKPSGKPNGMNMEMENQLWSSLQQRYESDDSEKYVELMLFGGNAPQMAGFQTMSNMNMETDDQIMKTVTVKGYKAILNLEKNQKKGSLMISLNEKMMAVVEAADITNESQIITLAEELPLDKFAGLAD
jgi:hypothetical protein